MMVACATLMIAEAERRETGTKMEVELTGLANRPYKSEVWIEDFLKS